MRTDEGFVYAAERDGLIKIGWSRDPARRARDLRANLLGFWVGGDMEELWVLAYLREMVGRLTRAPNGGPSRALVMASLGAALDRGRELEAQVATLTAERDALKRTVEVYAASLDFWPFQMREFIRTGDVEGMKREAARREAWVKDVHTEMHAGRITIATLTAERDSLRTRIENAEAGSVVAKAVIDRLTAERDAARVEIRDATEALDEWRPGSRESLAGAVTRLRQALQAADIDLEELFAARKAMSPGGMQRRELPVLVTALRAERESILAVVRDYASLMLSHDAVALVDRLRAVLKAGGTQDPQTGRPDGLARAAEAEREACAWLVEHLARTREATGPLALSEVAAAIRARGGKP